MNSDPLVVVCPAINDDLVLIAVEVAKALTRESWTWIGALDPLDERDISVRRLLWFSEVRAASVLQVKNIFAMARIAGEIGRSGAVLLACPSIVNLFVAPITRLRGRRLYAIVHDVDPHYEGLRGLLYSLQTAVVLALAHEVFAFSEHSKLRATERRVTTGNVVALPLPSPAEFIEVAKEQERPDERFDLGFFGRFEEYKGARHLPALAQSAMQHDRTLLVVTHAQQDDPIIEELRPFPNVTIRLGRCPTEELASLMSRTAWNVCPYLTATQSGVVSFAAACGTPSVVTNVGGLPEQVVTGITGLVLDLEELLTLAWLDTDRGECSPREKIQAHYREIWSFASMRNRVRSLGCSDYV